MANKFSPLSGKIPPCPAPGYYILIRTKEGIYWRLKRGLGKPAVLNDTMKRHAKLMKRSSKAASAMVKTLRPSLEGLDCGRITIRFSAFLRKSLLAGGDTDLSYFRDYDLQPRFPLEKLWRTGITVLRKKGRAGLQLQVAGPNIALKNSLADGYYFSAILLSGDPLRHGDGL